MSAPKTWRLPRRQSQPDARPARRLSSQWQAIINTTGDRSCSRALWRSHAANCALPGIRCEYPNSIYSCIWRRAKTPRSVRETISSEMWQQINSLYPDDHRRARKTGSESLPNSATAVRMGCHLFEGITHSTVSHNEAWYFYFRRPAPGTRRQDHPRPGREVFHSAASVADVGTPFDDAQWSALLKSVSGLKLPQESTAASLPTASSSFCCSTANSPRRRILHRQGRPGAARHHRHAPRRLLLRLGTTHRPAAVGTGLCPREAISRRPARVFDALQTK